MIDLPQTNKLIIFSAPSGSGKTTIVKRLLKSEPRWEFSISATSRLPRGEERDGVDYFFMTPEKFRKAVDNDEFIEWEEVYDGVCYGTLRSEVEGLWSRGKVVVFDVDVMGGIRLKSIFNEKALSIFIMPPSIEELRNRLITRGTDSLQAIEKRIGKAQLEIDQSLYFDKIIVNNDLATAIAETESVVKKFIG